MGFGVQDFRVDSLIELYWGLCEHEYCPFASGPCELQTEVRLRGTCRGMYSCTGDFIKNMLEL